MLKPNRAPGRASPTKPVAAIRRPQQPTSPACPRIDGPQRLLVPVCGWPRAVGFQSRWEWLKGVDSGRSRMHTRRAGCAASGHLCIESSRPGSPKPRCFTRKGPYVL